MKIEQNAGVAPGGAHISHNHRWGPPAPGSGAMAICELCGEKETQLTQHAECVGKPSVGVSETIHDYDPV